MIRRGVLHLTPPPPPISGGEGKDEECLKSGPKKNSREGNMGKGGGDVCCVPVFLFLLINKNNFLPCRYGDYLNILSFREKILETRKLMYKLKLNNTVVNKF